MQNFIDILQQVIDYIYQPINDVINTQIDTSTLIIKLGFGEIEWFNIPFDNLLYIIISITFYYLFIVGALKLIFIPYRAIRSLF
jgi:hypothetical protein